MMNRLKLVVVPLALSLCVILPLIQATDVQYCSRRAYDVKVSSVDIKPNPVVRGQEATFKISATTGKPITGGKVEIGVSYFGIHIHTENHDLDEETTVPISAGDFVLSHSQVLPGFTPPGPYTLTMKMYDENRRILTCISFGFTIGVGTAVADS
ncbi:hypothetical protein Tsubulata_020307 [Turnera subulata]|uniref:MD-2-related lipid-recognition domain-containing protein n=1 Tax=Turnera subulata TaxID=218843 RepID=A0A9Q0G7G7_9ROSI|nr:hypothetical protein Tsubulata_020307 [Turnera subulata]